MHKANLRRGDTDRLEGCHDDEFVVKHALEHLVHGVLDVVQERVNIEE